MFIEFPSSKLTVLISSSKACGWEGRIGGDPGQGRRRCQRDGSEGQETRDGKERIGQAGDLKTQHWKWEIL